MGQSPANDRVTVTIRLSIAGDHHAWLCLFIHGAGEVTSRGDSSSWGFWLACCLFQNRARNVVAAVNEAQTPTNASSGKEANSCDWAAIPSE